MISGTLMDTPMDRHQMASTFEYTSEIGWMKMITKTHFKCICEKWSSLSNVFMALTQWRNTFLLSSRLNHLQTVFSCDFGLCLFFVCSKPLKPWALQCFRNKVFHCGLFDASRIKNRTINRFYHYTFSLIWAYYQGIR